MGDWSVKTTSTGPLSTPGAAGRVIDSWVGAFADEAAREGLAEVKDILSADLKNPSGYYESRVGVVTSTMGAMVTDSGVIYGDWLESGGRRQTRFKGYRAFQRAAAALRQRLPAIDAATRPRFLEGMER